MAHFKGHKIKADDGIITFDGAVDVGELKRELESLRKRRKALAAKCDVLKAAMQVIAVEEAELVDVLREVGEDV